MSLTDGRAATSVPPTGACRPPALVPCLRAAVRDAATGRPAAGGAPAVPQLPGLTRRLRRLREEVRRRPRLGDALVAAVMTAVCGAILTGRSGVMLHTPTALDWVATVAGGLPLIWRRRAPVLVLAACMALMWIGAVLGTQSPAGFFVPLTALHAVARYRPARYVVPGILLIVPPVFRAPGGPGPGWAAFVAVTAITLVVALAGINQRTRHSYLTALEERARRLEDERDRQARLAVAEERTRIARDMHDIVAHHLTVMTALAEGAAATAPADPERAAGVMRQAATTGRQALGEMRRALGLLRNGPPSPPGATGALGGAVPGTGSPSGRAPRAGPAPVLPDARAARAPQPGLDDIAELVDTVRAAGLLASLTRTGNPGDWGAGAGLAVYRIVQEALTNTLKHARPHARAEVTLRYGPGHAEIDVLDDGGGHPARPASEEGRHGLTGMRERAASFDGWLVAGPRPGRTGWRVHAVLRVDGPQPPSAPAAAARSTHLAAPWA